jgi:hypothetical protein
LGNSGAGFTQELILSTALVICKKRAEAVDAAAVKRPQTPFPPPSWLVHVNGFVDLLPRQWSPLGTSDAKHANGVAVDQEDDAVDVWLLAKKASSRGTP